MAAAIGDWPQALDQFKRVLERNPENETVGSMWDSRIHTDE
jgi:hypothetical protein